MPRGNGMGPAGMGPMTGRAAGFCAANGQPGFANASGGRGCGLGRGRGGGQQGGGGHGHRRMFFATGLPGCVRTAGGVDAKQVLVNQAEALESELTRVREQLETLEKK
jgi:hypothetical protein